MIRRNILLSLCFMLIISMLTLSAQAGQTTVCNTKTRFENTKDKPNTHPGKQGKKKSATKLYTYYTYDYNVNGCDTGRTYVLLRDSLQCLFDQAPKGKTIPGYANELTYVTFDSLFRQLIYQDGNKYYSSSPYTRGKIEWKEEKIDATTTRYTTSINSNSIELVMSTKEGIDITPLVYYGYLKGALKKFTRNGQVVMELGTEETVKSNLFELQLSQMQSLPSLLGTRLERGALSKMKQQKLVQTWRIFDTAQIHWGAQNRYWTDHGCLPNLSANYQQKPGMPIDTVIHFAGGTVLMKRLSLPVLPSHYQWFVELHEQSNGDAYDRTGSLFVIPQNAIQTFFRGIDMSPDSLPIFFGKDGQRYQGMMSLFDSLSASKNPTARYLVPLELVRFFTPFGVHHFNDRIQKDDITWQDEAYYKQEVTDLAGYLQGDVWLGAFIGNYDGGGHKLTLDLKAYPQSETWSDSNTTSFILPLFNTCNTLEMAGQNYGKFFDNDSLTVRFYIPDNVRGLRLRYISTGHGGWDTGDEFIPKENHIIIDGQLTYSYTPWREDCGTFRDKNPVSGDGWNSVTSSDYSRSGWCPGTATQPVYFDLSQLAPGWHTITIAIPQGSPIEGGFSSWNVSGCLVGHFQDHKADSKDSANK